MMMAAARAATNATPALPARRPLTGFGAPFDDRFDTGSHTSVDAGLGTGSKTTQAAAPRAHRAAQLNANCESAFTTAPNTATTVLSTSRRVETRTKDSSRIQLNWRTHQPSAVTSYTTSTGL